MDYKAAPFAFRVRKALRYVRLYGVRRTLTKVRAQYRLHAKGAPLKITWRSSSAKNGYRDVGIIGCGAFAYSTIAYYCEQASPSSLSKVYDPIGQRAIALCEDFNAEMAVTDPEEIFADTRIRIVFVASNHSSHADYAIRAIEAGKHVHIEKPHVVSADQLERLTAAMNANPECKVFLGFNRPRSRHFSFLRDVLAKETGPLMINWFVAGHEIEPDHWYFSEAEGGRVLGNLCHWTDLTLQLVPFSTAFPCTVLAGGTPGSPSDFVLTFGFAEGSSAAITFSAKGHTFEGVREILNCHKGNALCVLRDFEETRADVGATRMTLRTFHRDHGHRENIVSSLRAARGNDVGVSSTYLRRTAALFLAAKTAIDARQPQIVSSNGELST